jgi:rare lipoprotein A
MNSLQRSCLLICLIIGFTGCSTKSPREEPPVTGGKKSPATQRPYVIEHKRYYPIPTAKGYREKGRASWYGKKFHGRKTANGETYDMYDHTAAHKTLPMNTMLLVRNLENGKTTVVRVNDRGPFVRKRIIDLTYTAARELDMIKNGTAEVEIIALAEEQKKQEQPPVQVRKTADKQPVVEKQERERKLVTQDFDTGKFYVQVGAFEHHANAMKLARQFAAQGRDVIIQSFPAAGIKLYRVMVYSGTSLKQARQYETWLENNGFPNALVIARDS